MNYFPLTTAQQAWQERTAEISERDIGPRAAEYDRKAEFPQASLNALRDAGLWAMRVPQKYGFIARANGDLDWLSGGGSEGSGEDYGYKAFMETVDVLVMGRKTYEHVLTFAAWPYGSKPVVVLSRNSVHTPPPIAASVESMACAPGEVVRRLARRGARHLYVDGGKTIQGFLKAGCIQQFIITRIPLLIGNGIPLFGPLTHDIRLWHIATRQFANGFVQSTYEVIG